jgi:hypothetical protein
LQNSAGVVNFLQEVLTTRATSSYPNVGGREKAEVFRKFWYIGVNDVNWRKKWECSTIEGTHQLHFVSSLSTADSTKLMCRDFSCFCVPCVMKDWEACENKEHVEKWRLVVIQIALPRDVKLQMEEFGMGLILNMAKTGMHLWICCVLVIPLLYL